MQEGWLNDSYVILFDDVESVRMTEGYGIADYLPGYRIVAILGWDDFVLADKDGGLFTIPTVPLDAKHLAAHGASYVNARLAGDARFTGKIKWYIKPIVFSGNASDKSNMTWVDIPTHQKLVRWWNQKYREIKRQP